MKHVRTHYEVLGLSPNATRREIIINYRKLVREFHPDVAQCDKLAAAAVFRRINVAYGVLRNEERRRVYDEDLASAQASAHDGSPVNGRARLPEKRGPKSMGLTIPDAMQLAEAAYSRRRAEEAETLCRRVLCVEPANGHAHRLLGDLCFERRKMSDALKHYSVAMNFGHKSLLLEDKVRLIKAALRISEERPIPEFTR